MTAHFLARFTRRLGGKLWRFERHHTVLWGSVFQFDVGYDHGYGTHVAIDLDGEAPAV